MYDNEDSSKVPGMYQKEDGSWNEKLELKALENQRIKYLTDVYKVIVAGIRIFQKDENKDIRKKALALLEDMWKEFKVSYDKKNK